MKQELNKVCIVGLGLIGGSCAKDLKQSSFASHLIGVESNKKNASKALALNLVDEVLSLEEAIPQSDLVVLAIPVHAVVSLLPQVLDLLPPAGVVTDMGSAKQVICQSVRDHKNKKMFVPSHPMAGTEDSGPQAAISHLFANKTAVICKLDHVEQKALDLVEKMYQSLLMKTLYMTPEDHDRHVAFVSHLPHVLSFVLAQTVLDEEESDSTIFDLASGGFESTARLGKSAASMWSPIFEQNKKYVSEAIQSYIKKLDVLGKNIDKSNENAVKSTISRANEIRRVLSQMEFDQAQKQLPQTVDEEFQEKLLQVRKEIDGVDREIVQLLGLRQKMSKSVGTLKKRHGIETVQENRWKQVLSQCLQSAQSAGLRPDFVMSIYDLIHNESLKTQENISKEDSHE